MNQHLKLSANAIIHAVEAIKSLYPELMEDDDAWLLALESETDTFDFLRMIERRRQEACALAGALAGNIAEMELRQGRFERREKAMRELIFAVMQKADIRKCELAEATLSVRNGQPKLIGGDDQELIDMLPGKFVRIKREPDRDAIKTELKAGGTVPGFQLSNSEPSLSIRTK